MRVSVVVMAAAVAVLSWGCAGGGNGPADRGMLVSAPAVTLDGQDARGTEGVRVPGEARFTIFCRDFTGPDHASDAGVMRDMAKQATGLDDFYVLRRDGRSVLYHGFYTTFDASDDAREATRARRDRQLIDRLVTQEGQRVFPRTLFEPIERPTPPAPAEWDLVSADGYWSTVVATYTDPALRKQAAVDSVRAAREMGIEAYFLHTESQSHVCVGTWPRGAVRQQMAADADELGIDPDNPDPIFVSTFPLRPEVARARDHEGRRVRVLQLTVEVEDPELQKVLQTYNYAVDGFEEARFKPPLLIEIHRETRRAPQAETEPMRPRTDPGMERLLRRPSM